MVRRFSQFPSTAPATPRFARAVFRAEELEARDTPSLTGTEDVLSQPLAAPARTGQLAHPLIAEPRGRFAVGTEGGGTAQVNVYDAKTNALIGIINPFGRDYTGAVTVATGDLTGDGVEDIVVGAGRGHTPQVKVFDGVTLRELGTLMAYSPTFTGGVSVAVGDVNGDGKAEIVASKAGTGPATVRVFSGDTLKAEYKAMESDTGVRVALQDIDGDGVKEVIAASGAGTAPKVKVLSGMTGATRREFPGFMPWFNRGLTVG